MNAIVKGNGASIGRLSGNESLDRVTRQLDAERETIKAMNGKALFRGLFDKATGQRLPAKLVPTWDRFAGASMKWVIQVPTGRDEWVRDTPRHLEARGLEARGELAPADVKVVFPPGERGEPTQVFIEVFRTDGGWPGARGGR